MKIKLLENGILPTKGSEKAAGWDLYNASGDIIIPAGGTVKINAGIAIEIPDGYFGGIYARSGLATKHGLAPVNCVGIIDSDYRGPVIVPLHNSSAHDVGISHGTRIAQLIIQPYQPIELELVEKLSDTERGDGGFGSTGTN